MAPENVHLTLKFLGSCPDEQLELIEGKLRDGLSGCPAFASRTNVFGAFPSPKKARVLWLGMEEGPDFERLYGHVEGSMTAIGFKAEERTFRPHITLARLKRPGRVDIEALGSKIDSGHVVQVGEVTLFASYLSQKGPVYEAVAKVALMSPRG